MSNKITRIFGGLRTRAFAFHHSCISKYSILNLGEERLRSISPTKDQYQMPKCSLLIPLMLVARVLLRVAFKESNQVESIQVLPEIDHIHSTPSEGLPQASPRGEQWIRTLPHCDSFPVYASVLGCVFETLRLRESSHRSVEARQLMLKAERDVITLRRRSDVRSTQGVAFEHPLNLDVVRVILIIVDRHGDRMTQTIPRNPVKGDKARCPSDHLVLKKQSGRWFNAIPRSVSFYGPLRVLYSRPLHPTASTKRDDLCRGMESFDGTQG